MLNEKENSYEIAARAKKIAAMVDAIDRAAVGRGMDVYEDAGTILSALEKYTEQSWSIVDRVAKLKNKSSDETREKVKEKYRERQQNAPF